MHGRGPAHDLLHVRRVAALARQIAEAEGADGDVVVPAAILHELVNYPKGDPRSSRSGDDCAKAAAKVLAAARVPRERAGRICACIRDHAFSKGVVPESLEAKVLQDADRLDAIGAVGIARWAATCEEMRRPFYDERDPFARKRTPDDKEWGLDHFPRKLLRLAERLHTATARSMAVSRHAFLAAFLDQLAFELGREPGAGSGTIEA